MSDRKALQKRWEVERKAIADQFFAGDEARAEMVLSVLPYSTIPGWSDVANVSGLLLSTEHDAEPRAEVERLRAGIKALHRPEPFHDDPSATFCAHCQRTAGVWPCPTVALLNPAEGDPDE